MALEIVVDNCRPNN